MSDDFHAQIASGAIGQDNHPTHAAGIQGGVAGNGNTMPGVHGDIGAFLSTGEISIPIGAPSPLSLEHSLKPGALGQSVNEQLDSVTNQMVTKSPEGKDLPALTDLGAGDIQNTKLQGLSSEIQHPGMSAGLGGGRGGGGEG